MKTTACKPTLGNARSLATALAVAALALTGLSAPAEAQVPGAPTISETYRDALASTLAVTAPPGQVDKYVVVYGKNQHTYITGVSPTVRVVVGNSSSYGLCPTVNIQVAAQNAAGVGPLSNVVTSTCPCSNLTVPPTNVTVKSTGRCTDGVDISWSPPQIQPSDKCGILTPNKYFMKYTESGVAVENIYGVYDSSPYTHFPIKANVPTTYQVQGRHSLASGQILLDSGWSNPVTFTCSCGGPVANRLSLGQTLTAGKFISSPNGLFRLIYESDGRLVLRVGSTQYWASAPAPMGLAGNATLRADGAIALTNGLGMVYGTIGTGGSMLAVQDDGNLVLYKPDCDIAWKIK